jgi:hypothetical protein
MSKHCTLDKHVISTWRFNTTKIDIGWDLVAIERLPHREHCNISVVVMVATFYVEMTLSTIHNYSHVKRSHGHVYRETLHMLFAAITVQWRLLPNARKSM